MLKTFKIPQLEENNQNEDDNEKSSYLCDDNTDILSVSDSSSLDDSLSDQEETIDESYLQDTFDQEIILMKTNMNGIC